MQLGTENRNKTIAAIALMVLALVVLVVMRLIPVPRHPRRSPTPVVTPPPGTRRIVTVRTASGKKARSAAPGAFA